MSRHVTRYVITHVGRIGLRTLTFAMQGRHTYETSTEAKAALDTFTRPGGLDRVLTPDQMATLEVRACGCYAGHFDPVGRYFDDEDVS